MGVQVIHLVRPGTGIPECLAHRLDWPIAGRIAVSSTKSLMGHLIAAAGAVEAAVCALTIHHGVLPENANLAEPDPECGLDFVCGGPRVRRIRVAVSNSFGFGGSNSCLVLRNPEEVEG